MERIWRKLENGRKLLPPPILHRAPNGQAEIGLISYGSTDPAILEARERLAAQGVATDYLRLRGVPFSPDVEAFIRGHHRTYVIEMNTDGQMRQLLQIEVPDQAGKLRSLTINNGLPMSARWVTEALLAVEEG
jgi:2-oxoglutarate ferredoxin oxidoreductase subunit alpha